MDESNNQDDVMSFFSQPEPWGEVPKRIDTPISAVFLIKDRAYKLKKAEKLPFLDYSQLEQRRKFCFAELEINRKTSPDLYLSVQAVTRHLDGHIKLENPETASGEILDYVVEMKRFSQGNLLSCWVDEGRVDRHLIHQLVDRIYDLHTIAPPHLEQDSVTNIKTIIKDAELCLRPYLSFIPEEKIIKITKVWQSNLERLTPLLRQRTQAGKVRWCHGDAHCNNVCIIEGQPYLFDAIEFSASIACVDVLYDLAFLLMDLQFRNAKNLAGYAMNHYFDLSGDYQGAVLMPLFQSLRAGIRAHVTASFAAQTNDKTLESTALDYLDFAIDLLNPPPTRLVAVGGLSGSGKSRMARELATEIAQPAAVVVRSDSLRKQQAGIPLKEKLSEKFYTPQASQEVYQKLSQTCANLLKDGVPVIADAVFSQPKERNAIAKVAKLAKVPFHGLWLTISPEIAAQRITNRKSNISDATLEILERQRAYDLGLVEWASIDSSGIRESVVAMGKEKINHN